MLLHYHIALAVVIVLPTLLHASDLINYADVQCGYNGRSGKVVGGSTVLSGEFPWMVSLTKRGGHFCGGSLITKKHVITAAHCVCSGIDGEYIRATSLKVTIGQHNLKEGTPDSYEMAVKTISTHPNYLCSKVKNDIAILELDNDVKWSDKVLPACLSRTHQVDNSAIVAGWGWLSENATKGGRANTLQKAEVNIMNNDKCLDWYKSQGKKTKIIKTQLCAGHENGGIDACWADSGGPLMVKNQIGKQFGIAGIVSTGIGCARPKLPGIYTRISEFLPWIEKELRILS